MGQYTIRTVETVNEQGEPVEVLYQKLGDRWYAFSMVDDEVFMGSINPEELEPGSEAARNRRAA